jgi:ArpU family phage transcriptional regulator
MILEPVVYDVDTKQVKNFLKSLYHVALVAHVNLADKQLSSHSFSDMPKNHGSNNTNLDMIDKTLQARETIEQVTKALAMMEETKSNIIKWRYLMGKTVMEISERLMLSQRQVLRYQKSALEEFALAYGMMSL